MHFIICTCPPGTAEAMIRKLLDERLIAGCNIVPALRSLYRWRGEICDEPEELMLMETSRERCEAAMLRLVDLHPYEVPKVVSLEAVRVHDAYRQWVDDMTRFEN